MTTEKNGSNKLIVSTDCEYVACALCGNSSGNIIARGRDYEYGTSELEFSFHECCSCHHLFLNPRPKEQVAGLMYPSTYYTLAGRHAKKGSPLIAFLKDKIVKRRLASFADLFSNGGRVLEVGCGDCALLLALKAAYPHLECVGMDLSFSDDLKTACGNAGVLLIEAPLESASLPEEEFDLVIMNQLIEHLWRPVEAMSKISSALKNNGFVSVETINPDGFDRRFFMEGYWGGYYFPRHLNLFTPASLGRLLSKSGFEVVRSYSLVAPIVWAFSMHAALSERPDGLITRLAMRFFTDKNPFCLALFTFIDLTAMVCGVATSNQKMIAKKHSAGK